MHTEQLDYEIEDAIVDNVLDALDVSLNFVKSYTWIGRTFYKDNWRNVLNVLGEAIKYAEIINTEYVNNPSNDFMLTSAIDRCKKVLHKYRPPKEEWERNEDN